MNATQKIAVISGATGYIGYETAKKLAADGMRIAMLYYGLSKEDAIRMVSELSGEGHNAYFCDISDENAVTQVIDRIEQEMGHLYACIHAAGTLPKPKQLHLSSPADLDEQFKVNIFGTFNFLSSCARRLKEHKDGVIIGITTAGVVTPINTKARGAYSVLKFALQGMLVALKEELSSFGIRVYSIAPGVLPGGLNRDTPKAFLEITRSTSPTKTLAAAEDVAEKISSLCLETANGISEFTFLIAPETGIMPK